MKPCPFCHQPVADDAAICPHAGCGKVIGVARRAPPPVPGRPMAARDATGPAPQPGPSAATSVPLQSGAASAVQGLGSGMGAWFRSPILWAVVALGVLVVLIVASRPGSTPVASQIDATLSPTAPNPDVLEQVPSMANAQAPAPAGADPAGSQTAASGDVAQSASAHDAVARLPSGIYTLRTVAPKERHKFLAVYGVTRQSEEAVAAGLRWLARHQAEDGHWGPDCLGAGVASRCHSGDVCPDAGQTYDMALTGLALLAFQAGGQYAHNAKEHSAVVQRGLDWMIAHQADDGSLISPTRSTADRTFMYEHGIAAFALGEACAVAEAEGRQPDPKLRAAAEKAIYYIVTQQHEDGGWRYTPNRSETSDTSVSGWQVLALKTAQEAGIEVPDPCTAKIVQFFRRCELGDRGRTGYQPGGSVVSDATTGVGILVHAFLLGRTDSPLVQDASLYLAELAERAWKDGSSLGRRRPRRSQGDFYTWYNCTLAMCQAGGEPWKRWNDVVRDLMIDLQVRQPDSCRDGSWDPQGRWDSEGGRIYCTALAILTLEVYYRYRSDRARVYLVVEPGQAMERGPGKLETAF